MYCVTKFAEVSGVSPSLQKSSSFFCNCSQDLIDWFDDKYGILRGQLVVRFLGVPLISSQLSINDYMPLVERITTHWNVGSIIFLSFAGRVQLIKVVLFSIQAFWSNPFMSPTAIHDLIQSLLTKFLWRGNINDKSGAKVYWKTIYLPHVERRSGINNSVE